MAKLPKDIAQRRIVKFDGPFTRWISECTSKGWLGPRKIYNGNWHFQYRGETTALWNTSEQIGYFFHAPIAHLTLPTSCPTCGAPLDAATSIKGDDTIPTDGDLTICVYCASFLRFTFLCNRLELRLVTPDAVAAMNDETRNLLLRARHLIESKKKS